MGNWGEKKRGATDGSASFLYAPKQRKLSLDGARAKVSADSRVLKKRGI